MSTMSEKSKQSLEKLKKTKRKIFALDSLMKKLLSPGMSSAQKMYSQARRNQEQESLDKYLKKLGLQPLDRYIAKMKSLLYGALKGCVLKGGLDR